MGRFEQPAERVHGSPSVPRGRGASVERPEMAGPAAGGPTAVGPLGPQTLAYLQRAAGNAGVAALLEEGEAPSPDAVLAGAGRPLDDTVRADMEGSLGADFSTVRVHDGPTAAASARALGARAYTVGEDVVVGDGGADRRTIAHELTHVVQQRSGPVDGTPTEAGFSVSDPGDPFERAATATAEAILGGSDRGTREFSAGAGVGVLSAHAAQRESLSDVGGGGTPTGAAQAGAPNPVVAAMWQYAVQGPLRTAANELSNEKPDHHAAYEALRQASDGLEAAMGALQSGDPRLVKANYLMDDLKLIRLWLAPRANVTVGGTDESAAAKVGGMEYDAQVVGESLGGNPAPHQVVNPALGSGE